MIRAFISKYRSNLLLRHIFWITIVYVLSQGFLLIVSGTWWDDWVFIDRNWEYLYEVMLNYTIPLQAYIDASLWLLPDGAYRILVFLYFYAGSILLYLILRKIEIFSQTDAFWITLLYITIPINDVRITWICYGYSLGLFMFWIAFYLVTLWQDKERAHKKTIGLRVLSLLVLLLSFNTESIMLMTLVILLYLYYEKLKDEWKWERGRLGKNVRNFLMAVVSYLDFLIAPIIFYFGKHLLIHGKSVVGGHNYVDWPSVPRLLAYSPYYIWLIFKGLLENYKAVMNKRTVLIIMLAVVAGSIAWAIKDRKGEEKEKYGKIFLLFLIGIFVFWVGVFPYILKVGGGEVETTGVSGRYALLLGLGTALILYYFNKMIFDSHIRKIISVSFIALGICHFNLMYLDWQGNYYQQLCFEKEVSENQNILNNDTFLCLFQGDYACIYYQTNGNSYAATGEQTRVYFDSIDEIASLKEWDATDGSLKAYCMRDWDYSSDNLYIDGLILFRNKQISNLDLLKLKCKELFNRDEFEQDISNMRKFVYVPVTKSESDALVEASKKEELSKQNIWEYVAAYPVE